MNEYECRYYSGETRYTRRFLVGHVKAADIIQAARKAQLVADRKGLQVASVTLVFPA